MKELFDNIDEPSKIRILQDLEAVTRKYEKNKIILSSTKSYDIICLVVSGHVQVVKNDASGNSTVIEDLYDNDIFGSISANISSNDYEIMTKEKSEIIIIEFDNILSFNNNLNLYNTFIKNLLKVLYNKTQEFNNRIEILTNKSIRDKLLAYFRIMTKNNNTKTIYLPFSYSDLADYLAVNRSAMSREMKSLKEEGLIEVKGKKIKLLYYI